MIDEEVTCPDCGYHDPEALPRHDYYDVICLNCGYLEIGKPID